MQLSWDPTLEVAYEEAIKNAARRFVRNYYTIEESFDVISILFSIQPKAKTVGERRIQIVDMATDQIRTIISYAAADAHTQERIKFYHTISKQPGFKASAGTMFKRFFLSWLTSNPHLNVEPLHCSPAIACQSDLQIPVCGEEQTNIFSSLTALRNINVDKLPLCLLPASQNFTAIDAIIFTNQLIITVQVTISKKHNVKKGGLTNIERSISPEIRKDRKWCHAFITDNEGKTVSLCHQTLNNLPQNTCIYSGVFDVSQSGITHEHMKALDKSKVSGS